MELSAALPLPIQQALQRGCTVLTANQRAARALHRAFDLHQRALGRAIWEPPAIFAWETWLTSLWHRLLLDGHASDLLLNSTQEHTLWSAIVAADPVLASLRPVDALAQTAADAWRLLHDYRSRQRLHAFPGNSDTRAFARWAGEFERRSARARYLTQAQLPEALRVAVVAGHLTLPTELLLVGFDLITPAQTALLDAVRAAGTSIDEQSPGAPSKAVSSPWMGDTEIRPAADGHTLTLVAAPDERDELAACARWLRARLAQQPAARIAVIVPSIETGRAEIDRVFRHILAPELDDIAAPAYSGPYEFSLGVPLAHTPIAATALDILRWTAAPLPLDCVSSLLLSPHFAEGGPSDAPGSTPAASERLARAEFDAFVLRRQPLLQPHISLDDLCTLASNPKHGADTIPILLTRLRALRPLCNKTNLSAKRTHADWAAVFNDILTAAGWATLSHLDSTEFQARRKLESALDELATLDFDSPFSVARVPFKTALAALQRIAAQTLFAPESRHAPIQVMGPLESAGSAFDSLWFLRANDLAWPSRHTPNPLLSWLLQRDLAMPGVDPAHDTALARHTTERIAASAPVVLFSYAQQTADGHQRPSPILTALAADGLTLDLRTADYIAPPGEATAPIQLEPLLDDAPIPPPPDRVLSGGAAILKSQAACAFRSFAEWRLFSSALDSVSLGLDPRQRGSLVHAVLQRFWTEVHSQAALQRMTHAERIAQLNRAIDATFAAHFDKAHAHPGPGWPRAYLRTERQRLLSLLNSWLDYEADERPPFTVLAREEELHDVHIGPLRIDIRVDRIDRVALADGSTPDPTQSPSEIILDYKTGPATPADWLGNRPNEPQLPLYAVVTSVEAVAGAAADANDALGLAAVAFANVRPGERMGLHGYQARNGILPKAASAKLTAASLAAQIDEWRAVLTALAQDFHSGHASVSPKQYPKTCSNCQQRLLCRLDPTTLEADSLGDFDAGPDLFNPSESEAARG